MTPHMPTEGERESPQGPLADGSTPRSVDSWRLHVNRGDYIALSHCSGLGNDRLRGDGGALHVPRRDCGGMLAEARAADGPSWTSQEAPKEIRRREGEKEVGGREGGNRGNERLRQRERQRDHVTPDLTSCGFGRACLVKDPEILIQCGRCCLCGARACSGRAGGWLRGLGDPAGAETAGDRAGE